MCADTNITDIMAAINPEEWLDYLGVRYRRATGSSGSQLQIHRCPRCGGTGGKVYLNAETGLGNCFHGACVGEPGFNLFTFTKHHEKDGKKAYALMANFARELGWRPKVHSPAQSKPKIEVESDVILPDSIGLPQGTKNHPYLTKRGITLETTAHFRLRYASDGYFKYTDQEGKKRYQKYSQRILLPVFDLQGKLVTFQGRDVSGTAERRYLFPPGLPGTGRYLFNGQNAMGAEEIILNEGAFDVMATHQAIQGDTSLTHVVPVGTFGKSLSMSSRDQDDQLKALFALKAAGLKRVTFMWDAEQKTLIDTMRAAEKLHRYGFCVRIARLPPDCDPNEVPASEVRRAFYQAITVSKSSLIKFKLDLLKA